MTLSQNGYQGLADYGDAALVSNPAVPGAPVKVLGGLLAGDVATVLLWVAARFHAEVEPLAQDQGVWGFEPRVIRGSTVLSNHASGTAIDLNSALHSLGATGTFSSGQRAAIRQILNDAGGVIRWGGDYVGRKDEMHFEIDADPSSLAARIRSGGPTTSSATTPEDIMATLSDADVSRIAERVWSQIIKEAGDLPVWAVLQQAATQAPTADVIAERVWSQIIKEAGDLPVWALLARAAAGPKA